MYLLDQKNLQKLNFLLYFKQIHVYKFKKELLEPICRLKLVQNEFACLKALILLQSDLNGLSISTHILVSETRARVQQALFLFLAQQLSTLMETTIRFASILNLLPALTGIAEAITVNKTLGVLFGLSDSISAAPSSSKLNNLSTAEIDLCCLDNVVVSSQQQQLLQKQQDVFNETVNNKDIKVEEEIKHQNKDVVVWQTPISNQCFVEQQQKDLQNKDITNDLVVLPTTSTNQYFVEQQEITNTFADLNEQNFKNLIKQQQDKKNNTSSVLNLFYRFLAAQQQQTLQFEKQQELNYFLKNQQQQASIQLAVNNNNNNGLNSYLGSSNNPLLNNNPNLTTTQFSQQLFKTFNETTKVSSPTTAFALCPYTNILEIPHSIYQRPCISQQRIISPTTVPLTTTNEQILHELEQAKVHNLFEIFFL